MLPHTGAMTFRAIADLAFDPAAAFSTIIEELTIRLADLALFGEPGARFLFAHVAG
jgi:hypothetical protein